MHDPWLSGDEEVLEVADAGFLAGEGLSTRDSAHWACGDAMHESGVGERAALLQLKSACTMVQLRGKACPALRLKRTRMPKLKWFK